MHASAPPAPAQTTGQLLSLLSQTWASVLNEPAINDGKHTRRGRPAQSAILHPRRSTMTTRHCHPLHTPSSSWRPANTNEPSTSSTTATRT
ncbi:hypothetical protein SCHPADRAFT_555955 [Schizopora paradoxa]|uniref:Uncharacterized protein n=1 Tax=Schizopora paradoxa TaxID=27342 RepID=A0A0H2RCT1_9AGAM|nr:hypothetical protein SCHPADRAFT_555955 [Schizopora paradoxa]